MEEEKALKYGEKAGAEEWRFPASPLMKPWKDPSRFQYDIFMAERNMLITLPSIGEYLPEGYCLKDGRVMKARGRQANASTSIPPNCSILFRPASSQQRVEEESAKASLIIRYLAGLPLQPFRQFHNGPGCSLEGRKYIDMWKAGGDEVEMGESHIEEPGRKRRRKKRELALEMVPEKTKAEEEKVLGWWNAIVCYCKKFFGEQEERVI